jgi:UDP-glucose 4-epimerase
VRILLYGGSGFLGLNLAHHFSDIGDKVIIVSRSEPLFLSPNVEYICWDTFQSEPRKILKEIDILFYLIGRSSPRQEDFDLTSACQAEIDDLNFLFCAICTYKVALQFVYLSSGGAVYGNSKGVSFCEADDLDPITAYGKVKKIGEQVVTVCAANGNIPYLVLRPSNIYGRYQPSQRQQGVISIFTDLIIRSKKINIFGNGNSKKDYIHIDDFLSAVYGLLYSKAVGTFNIGSGFHASVNEIVSILESELKVQVNRNYVDLCAPDVSSLSLNCEKLTAATGFSGTLDLKTGIRCYLKGIL